MDCIPGSKSPESPFENAFFERFGQHSPKITSTTSISTYMGSGPSVRVFLCLFIVIYLHMLGLWDFRPLKEATCLICAAGREISV